MITGAPTPSDTTNLACSGPARPWASTSSPRSRSSCVQRVLELDVGLDVLGGPLGHRRAVGLDLSVVLQQHESHRVHPSSSAAPRWRRHPDVEAATAVLDIGQFAERDLGPGAVGRRSGAEGVGVGVGCAYSTMWKSAEPEVIGVVAVAFVVERHAHTDAAVGRAIGLAVALDPATVPTLPRARNITCQLWICRRSVPTSSAGGVDGRRLQHDVLSPEVQRRVG